MQLSNINYYQYKNDFVSIHNVYILRQEYNADGLYMIYYIYSNALRPDEISSLALTPAQKETLQIIGVENE